MNLDNKKRSIGGNRKNKLIKIKDDFISACSVSINRKNQTYSIKAILYRILRNGSTFKTSLRSNIKNSSGSKIKK